MTALMFNLKLKLRIIYISEIYEQSNRRRKPADFVTFTEKILNGKLRFLCGGDFSKVTKSGSGDRERDR